MFTVHCMQLATALVATAFQRFISSTFAASVQQTADTPHTFCNTICILSFGLSLRGCFENNKQMNHQPFKINK
jgi:hypothetical protein